MIVVDGCMLFGGKLVQFKGYSPSSGKVELLIGIIGERSTKRRHIWETNTKIFRTSTSDILTKLVGTSKLWEETKEKDTNINIDADTDTNTNTNTQYIINIIQTILFVI